MGRSARFVVTLLVFQPLVMSLLPAMSVPSLSAALAMSTSARRGTSAALSARLDTRDRKVGFCTTSLSSYSLYDNTIRESTSCAYFMRTERLQCSGHSL